MSLALNLWNSIAGLPAHPLFVHAAVVLGPLAALGIVAMQFRSRWRITYGTLTIIALVAATVTAFLARQSGQFLAGAVGVPAEHAQLGSAYPFVVLVLAVVGTTWLVLEKRLAQAPAGEVSAVPAVVMQIVAAVAAVAVLVLAVLTGHSGAQAVWGGAGGAGAPSAPTAPSAGVGAGAPSGVASPGPTAVPGASATLQTYTLAKVSEHGDAASCWAAIDGKVYDLTSWISVHPGGSRPILAMCGTDASAAFAGQHGESGKAKARLAGLQIGVLG